MYKLPHSNSCLKNKSRWIGLLLISLSAMNVGLSAASTMLIVRGQKFSASCLNESALSLVTYLFMCVLYSYFWQQHIPVLNSGNEYFI
ncbi:hypothetical protein HYPSUDRAFT_631156 [Hypholoma sublateritium FD-334 SS-4]|uniref:Uncharacterized protein n=1 Tax=Hypholoma sublateritium (strain FD-334 SS-4) TaxID=945553 RepID=A0A0D2PKS5_HYPSF|nr:hypothetical protein HYPSUDRAFT_631156 [Hypholoma sublateritium FD-334 SS-4]